MIIYQYIILTYKIQEKPKVMSLKDLLKQQGIPDCASAYKDNEGFDWGAILQSFK